MALFLVTGGCGFIGSHLASTLIAEGHRVRVLDDLSVGKPDGAPSGAELLVGDVSEPETVRAAFDGIAGCFHLAAVASVQESGANQHKATRTNLLGTISILDAARRTAGTPVVYASSAAVYGDQPVLPANEAAPAKPISSYGVDKLGCETHARVAGAVAGVPTMGLRFFNVYGPRLPRSSPYSGVIAAFCDSLLHRRPITIYGDGSQTRDFIFIDDVIAALIRAMERTTTGAPVLNVSTGIPTSIHDLARLLATLTGADCDIQYAPAQDGDIRHSTGSTRAAFDVLGWRAQVPVETGLQRMLDSMP